MTQKQEKFITEYLTQLNATEAAFRVYCCKSRKVAAQIGYENLRKPEIKREVGKLFESEGLTLSLVTKALKKTILEGAGKHAKASDSLKALEILWKAQGVF